MGRPHPAHRGVDEDSPYVLRGLENGKTQLERLTGGPVLERHPRLFYQDQPFEPPNTYRGLENEKRQKEISRFSWEMLPDVLGAQISSPRELQCSSGRAFFPIL